MGDNACPVAGGKRPLIDDVVSHSHQDRSSVEVLSHTVERNTSGRTERDIGENGMNCPQMLGPAGRSRKHLDDIRALSVRGKNLTRSEAADQCEAARVVGELRHAGHEAGGHEELRTGIDAALRGIEVQHRSRSYGKAIRETSNHPRSLRRGHRDFKNLEAGRRQVLDRAFGELGARESQHRDHALGDQPLPKIRFGAQSTISGTKTRIAVTADTAMRNGADSRV